MIDGGKVGFNAGWMLGASMPRSAAKTRPEGR